MSNFTRKKIGVLGYGFTGWGGGIDFIRLMLSYLDEVELNDKSFSKIIILPRDDALVRVKNAVYPLRKFIDKVNIFLHPVVEVLDENDEETDPIEINSLLNPASLNFSTFSKQYELLKIFNMD